MMDILLILHNNQSDITLTSIYIYIYIYILKQMIKIAALYVQLIPHNDIQQIAVYPDDTVIY